MLSGLSGSVANGPETLTADAPALRALCAELDREIDDTALERGVVVEGALDDLLRVLGGFVVTAAGDNGRYRDGERECGDESLSASQVVFTVLVFVVVKAGQR